MRRVDVLDDEEKVVGRPPWQDRSSVFEASGADSPGIGAERSANATLAKLVASATLMVSPCNADGGDVWQSKTKKRVASCKKRRSSSFFGDFPFGLDPAGRDQGRGRRSAGGTAVYLIGTIKGPGRDTTW